MAAEPRRPRALARAVVAVVAVLALGACASESPDVPTGADGTADPELVLGREIYAAQCASCHGAGGGGGAGPALSDGRVERAYPDLADQIALVANGRGAMPAFGERLDAEELEAVVRYTREVL
ncbi:MAG TPA: cytochrome c [Acidimicrobiales bacterium]|nr:cytochrome c [Acidimicrobiales bacterium]